MVRRVELAPVAKASDTVIKNKAKADFAEIVDIPRWRRDF